MLPYTIDEISQRVMPVAKRYGLSAVYLFGSYARGEATSKSVLLPLILWKDQQIDAASSIFVRQWKKKR